jgi:hypothetical protein
MPTSKNRVMIDTADLWKSVGLLEATQQHFDTTVAKVLSPNSLLQKELMFAVNRVNYNQNASMNYLAGMGRSLLVTLLYHNKLSQLCSSVHVSCRHRRCFQSYQWLDFHSSGRIPSDLLMLSELTFNLQSGDLQQLWCAKCVFIS